MRGWSWIANNISSAFGFGIIQPDAGTSPTAGTQNDTLTLTSSDSSVTVTGNAGTKTIDLKVNPAAVSTSLTYYFSSANSSISGYEQLQSLAQYVPAAEASTPVSASTTPAIIEEFATNLGYPNITKIPAGTVWFHYEVQKSAGSNNYYTYAQLYKRNLAGTETLLLTSDNSSQSALNTRQQVSVSAANLADIALLSTDRLVVKVYAVMVSSTATITIYYDDNTDSRLQLPYVPADATNFVPYVGATQNVNLGSTYKVTNMVDPTSAQDAATKNYVDPTTSAISASDIDWSVLKAKGGVYTKTLAANTTFTFSNLTAGQNIVVRLTNTMSNYSVTWPTVKWPGGATHVMSLSGKTDVITFIYDGTNIYGSYIQDMF